MSTEPTGGISHRDGETQRHGDPHHRVFDASRDIIWKVWTTPEYIVSVQHERQETRDMHLNSAMELGMNESDNHLEALVMSLASGTLET